MNIYKLKFHKYCIIFYIFWGVTYGFLTTGSLNAQEKQEYLNISSFDLDVTPPVGSNYLSYDPQIGTWDLSLRAKGIIISGSGQPVVLCSIDWLSIGNEGMDAFKNTLAEAAGTVPERVSVHSVHQHDAPRCDFGAEQRLLIAGLNPAGFTPTNFDGTFARETLLKLREIVKNSLNHSVKVNRIGFGKAEVFQVASNRNIYDKNGMVRATRFSAAKNAELRAEPEGVIDPDISLVSFWNDDEPVAVLSFYATHPQSYYRTGIPNPDFPGVARFIRQMSVPQAIHIHFTGAAGNIAAGKYNDGSPENRWILAGRLADGMKRAWEATEKYELKNFDWKVEKITLPPRKNLYKIKDQLSNDKSLYLKNNGLARKMAFLDRMEAGKKIDVGMFKTDDIRILFMPGELFVEYQLAAKKFRPDLKIAMAASGHLNQLGKFKFVSRNHMDGITVFKNFICLVYS